jgi:ribose-phosphate pyrophosphokinase
MEATKTATGYVSANAVLQPLSPVTEMPVVLLAGSASHQLRQGVEHALGMHFGACTAERFPDGEVFVRLDQPVRGREVILLQATCAPVNDHLVELLALADACRRAAAARVVAVVPYFGYARSDRRDGRRAGRSFG